MASELVAKVTSEHETINFYRDGEGVVGYRFPHRANPYKPTPTMQMSDGLDSWLNWAKDNGYTVDYQGPID